MTILLILAALSIIAAVVFYWRHQQTGGVPEFYVSATLAVTSVGLTVGAFAVSGIL